MIKAALTLGLLMAAAGGLLAALNHATRDTVAANETRHQSRILEELTGEAIPARPREDVIACARDVVALAGGTRGYGGQIELLVAFTAAGTMRGVRATQHSETPGFADILDPDDWVNQFSITPAAQVDAVSGATITANAVKRVVAAQQARFNSMQPWCPS
ncbi:MAG: FMN-binding protein [Gammaproteobacteria bacterium]|nr:FMN-binding protein [Gammaproteobacteria bacterium]